MGKYVLFTRIRHPPKKPIIYLHCNTEIAGCIFDAVAPIVIKGLLRH